MDKELLDLLNEAKASGANEQQLQGIVDAYKQKKKPVQENEVATSKELPIGTEETLPSKSALGFISGVDIKGDPLFKIEQPNTIQVKDKDGTPLSLNTRSIPIVYLGDNKDYAKRLQERIDTGKTTPEDEKILARNKRGGFFDSKDESELYSIADSYGKVNDISVGSIDDKLKAISQLENEVKEKSFKGVKIDEDFNKSYYQKNRKSDSEYKEELSKLTKLKDKLAEEKAINETNPIYYEAIKTTDESGNLLKKALNRLATVTPQGVGAGMAALSLEKQNSLAKLPTEFSLGLAKLKYREPVEYERISQSLSKGEPISETQIANITAQGLDIAEKQANLFYGQKLITPEEYKNQLATIQKGRYENLIGNKETLRAVLADGIANYADEINVAMEKSLPVGRAESKIFGHKWNYSDEEIEAYAKAVAQSYGIDYNDPRVKEAVKYLQDNEGVMIMQNSIAKNGFIRDLAKGLAQPIRGISSTLEGITKSDAEKYAEAQSAGNVNVSEKKLKRIDDSWEGVVSDVAEGTGQFVTQAGLAYLTSGAIGAAGRGLLGRAGIAAVEGDIALADMGVKDLLGSTMLKSADGLSTFITAYGQSYDNNLKQAYSYTSDNDKAKITAGVLSGLEGATELFLSPLDIARGISKKLINSKSLSPGIIKILSDKNITNKAGAVAKAVKASVLETGKVIGAEIGEEEVTQIADYAANAMLNPNSETFKDRSLSEEMWNTVQQTGLSMVVPALASGAGAYKVNKFSKGSLMIAAQNRQKLLHQMNVMLDKGELSQDEYNEKAEIINTASKANDLLPRKDNGQKLTSEEKANYVYSRVSEAVLRKQVDKLKKEDTGVDDAEIKQKERKIKEQTEYRENVLSLKPMYFVNDEMVDKKDFDKVVNSPERDNYELVVENDEITQQKLREIGGKDLIYSDGTEYFSNKKEKPQEKKSIEEELLGELVLPVEDTEVEVSEPAVTEISDTEIIPTFQKVSETITPERLGKTESVIKRVNNADEINENELSEAEDALYEAWDAAPESRHLIEPLIQKLQDYEFATKTEISTVIEKVPTGRTNKAKIEIKPALEQSAGSRVSIRNEKGAEIEGVLRIENGTYIISDENGNKVAALGEKVINDKGLKLPNPETVENPIQFDKDGNVSAVTFETKDGRLVTIKNAERALDIAIQLQVQELGDVPESMFNEVYEEVERTVSKEVLKPVKKKVEQKAQKPVEKKEKVVEVKEEPTPPKEVSTVSESEGVSGSALEDVEVVAKKHFSDDAISKAKEAENNNEGILINMPIDEFLSLSPKGDNAEKRATVSKLAKEGTKFNEIPFLNFTHDGNGNAEVTGHEGRHRAMELKAQGETTIPVLLRNRAGGQGEVNINKESISNEKNFNEDLNPNAEKFPTKLRGHLEQKNIVIDFPLKEQSTAPTQYTEAATPAKKESGGVSGSALKDVESTAKALEGVKFNANFNLPLEQTKSPKQVSEAYHKAKADGTNPELVKAVEDLLGKAPTQYTEAATPKPTVSSAEQKKTKKVLPKIEVEKSDGKLFDEINEALKLEGNKNKQMALERLYSGAKPKYTKEEVDAALKINSTFEDIVKDMEDDGLLTKECK